MHPQVIHSVPKLISTVKMQCVDCIDRHPTWSCLSGSCRIPKPCLNKLQSQCNKKSTQVVFMMQLTSMIRYFQPMPYPDIPHVLCTHLVTLHMQIHLNSNYARKRNKLSPLLSTILSLPAKITQSSLIMLFEYSWLIDPYMMPLLHGSSFCLP